MLETYQARYPTPFAVLGIRTGNGTLAGIDYLPRGAATLSPLNGTAEEVCREIERYLDDPGLRGNMSKVFTTGVRAFGLRATLSALKEAEIRAVRRYEEALDKLDPRSRGDERGSRIS